MSSAASVIPFLFAVLEEAVWTKAAAALIAPAMLCVGCYCAWAGSGVVTKGALKYSREVREIINNKR